MVLFIFIIHCNAKKQVMQSIILTQFFNALTLNNLHTRYNHRDRSFKESNDT